VGAPPHRGERLRFVVDEDDDDGIVVVPADFDDDVAEVVAAVVVVVAALQVAAAVATTPLGALSGAAVTAGVAVAGSCMSLSCRQPALCAAP